MNTTLTTIETKTCSRCGGSGKYSYCQIYGDRCFKCKGSCKVRTKRGEAANAYIIRLRSKPASELIVGDVVFHEGFCAGPINDPSGWVKVLSITHEANGQICIETERCQYRRSGETLFRVRQTKEDAERTYAAGMAYQATLKPDGTPYKRLAKTA